MKIYLATFYSGDLKRSATRFKEQALQMGIYDFIYTFSYDDLNEEFKLYVNDLLKKGKKKGYGYWVWQTYIHQKVLSKLNPGDIYHWCDVGCHFNYNGKKRLEDYVNIVSEDDIGFLGFDYKNLTGREFSNLNFPNYLEYQYTKEDLFKYFNVQKNLEITETPQVWGGSFFIKKTNKSIKIMKEHYDITRNKFELIDDDPSKFLEKSRSGFIQHRHSQSVLSIIVKLSKCKLLSAYESEWALNKNNQRTFSHLDKFPIIAKRDKKKNFFKRFLDRQKKNYARKIKSIKS
jgi:hypothetical protein